MPENRFYLKTHYRADNKVELAGEEFHHLKVMRKKEGDPIELVNGENQLGYGQISQMNKDQAKILIESVIDSPPPRRLILAQGMVKPPKLDIIVEKGTELGATDFWFFPGDKSEKTDLSPNQQTRLKNLTISAMKQCGRLDLPIITLMPPLKEWPIPPGQLFYGDIRFRSTFEPPVEDCLIFIGPESGFSPTEERLLIDKFKARGVGLSPHILRAETAALCAISLFNQITNK